MPTDRRDEPDPVPLHATERRLFRLALACAALVFLGLALPSLRGLLLTENDLGNFHIPMRFFYSGALQRGESFLWFPYEYLGFHLHGEGQVAMAHPLNLLAYRWLPFEAAFNFEFLRSYALLFLGTFFLLRRRELPRSAAAVGGLLFAFCGSTLVRFMHISMVSVMAHLPLALLAIDVALTSERRGRRVLGLVGLALVTASQILHGHPQFTWISFVAEAGFALLTAIRARRPSGLVWLFGAQLVAVALGGVQLLPQWEAFTLSARVATAEAYAYGLSPHPINLFQLVAPYLFDRRAAGAPGPEELSFYAGAVAPVLVAWWLGQPRRLRFGDNTGLAALALAAIALLLALGENGGLYQLHAALPIVGHFRGPARFLILFQLGIAVAAAVAFAAVSRVATGRESLAQGSQVDPVRVRRLAFLVPLGASVAVAAAGLLARAGHLGLPFAEEVAPPHRMALGVALFAAATVAVWQAARGRRAALYVLVLLAACDHGAYGLSAVYRRSPLALEEFRATGRVPSWWDYGHRMRFGPPVLTMRGVRLVNGYTAVPPLRRLDSGGFKRPRRDRREIEQALRVMRVRYAWGRPILDPLPRARMVPEAVVIRDLERQMAEIDVETQALVDSPIALGGGAPGRARISSDRPGAISVETQAASRQLLVVSEGHHPGWQVAIDGVPAALESAYGDLIACTVEPGRHRVEFHFAPASVRRGAWLSACGAALLLLLAVLAAHFA